MEPITESYSANAGGDTETGTSVAIHAGFPNPAADRTGSTLSLDKLLVRSPSSTYFFRIRGHSWHRWGVFDGDIAVIDRAISPRERELVVWWQPDGTFVLSPFDRAIANVSGQNVWGTITAIVHPVNHLSMAAGQGHPTSEQKYEGYNNER